MSSYISPDEQLQIGDEVVYIPEGVFTEVIGYEWAWQESGAPSISRYRLGCGISSDRAHIKRLVGKQGQEMIDLAPLLGSPSPGVALMEAWVRWRRSKRGVSGEAEA